MKFFEPFAGDVSINLGGRKVTMAEQQLHYAQISAVIEQMGGKRMAQAMR